MTTTHTIDVEAERQMRADYEQWKDANNVTGGDGLLLRLFSAGWLAAKRSIQPTIAAEDVREAALLREALAVFDSMLEGCRVPKFGDYQNGDGEEIGPRMDALHARLRAIATPTPPSKG